LGLRRRCRTTERKKRSNDFSKNHVVSIGGRLSSGKRAKGPPPIGLEKKGAEKESVTSRGRWEKKKSLVLRYINQKTWGGYLPLKKKNENVQHYRSRGARKGREEEQ